MRKTLRLVLTGVTIALCAAAGWSAPRGGRDANDMARIWVINVGSTAAEVRVERSTGDVKQQEPIAIEPGEAVELQRSAAETVSLPGQRDLLLVTASRDFDPAAIHVAAAPPDRFMANVRDRRNGPVRSDDAAEASAETRLKAGETVSLAAPSTGAELRTLSLGLRGAESWAEVQLQKPDGAILGYVTFSAARPLDVTIDFSQLLDASRYSGPVSQRILARAGEVIAHAGAAAVTRVQPGGLGRLTTKSLGTGYFNYNINWWWTPPLTYTVDNGPANTCGELNVERNGTWYFTPGWLCTNGSGHADKGPWYWSSQTDDETSQAFIRWPSPYNDATTTDWHIWDVKCPSIAPDQFCQGSPPSCWQGFASDPPYGACFNAAWTSTYSYFAHVDRNTGAPLDYWSPATGTYGNSATQVNASLPGMPTCSANWSSSFPAANAHTSGQAYRWDICIYDGGCTACFQHDFIAP